MSASATPSASFTPGPWRTLPDAQGPCIVMHPTRDGVAIASLTDSFKPNNGFHDDWYVEFDNGELDQAATRRRVEERNANAHLIAAAPELYGALKDADWIIDAAYNTAEWLNARRSIETDEIRERVKTALAKAEGRS